MCTPYNELECDITTSTIDDPDTTFVTGSLAFRGLSATGGVSLVVSPDSVLINGSPPILQPNVSMSGLFNQIDYSLLTPLQQTQEQTFNLMSSYSNTGIFVGNNLTITIPGFYKICFNPTCDNLSFPDIPNAIIYRIRRGSNIYAEFYEQSIGNDEQTTPFSHVIYLVNGVYNFTVQVPSFTSLGYLTFLILPSAIGVKLV